MDELILLSQGDARRVSIDSRNARVLYRLLKLFALWAVLEAMIWIGEGEPLQAVRSVLTLILVRWLLYVRDRPLMRRHFRPIFLGYLTVQLLLLRVFDPDLAAVFQPQDYFLPGFLFFFRVPVRQAAMPVGALWLASSGRHLLTTGLTDRAVDVWQLVILSAISIAVLRWVGRLTAKLQSQFLDIWRRESRRHRERSRMREELDDARKIQLSMLPRRDPKIPWLDVAGISIPASEVGGDYYDYFEVSESRQTIVIADVAGHGVASGLLLTGIRSCLYLLQESPLSPREILSKLDRMVRQTTGTRLFVTMLYAVLDDDRKELTLSSAGHPPLLRYIVDTHEVEEIGIPALPLGTALGNDLGEKTVPFRSGDIFLFYTDGIAETLDGRQQLYGNERLIHRLRATAHDRSAREIRDTLLGDVWNFKGDGEQTDDITMVVVKVR
ncbi:MAG: PP2C family protein-serine/threonine phosphatase [bacterium]|nr:PP2C family protein-serine/threonine phosphatase [bacterium]